MKTYYVNITLNGYAMVQGDSKQEALEKAKQLTEADFNFEPFSQEILDDATILNEIDFGGGAYVGTVRG